MSFSDLQFCIMESLCLKELKEIAKNLKISGYYKLTKPLLISEISKAQKSNTNTDTTQINLPVKKDDIIYDCRYTGCRKDDKLICIRGELIGAVISININIAPDINCVTDVLQQNKDGFINYIKNIPTYSNMEDDKIYEYYLNNSIYYKDNKIMENLCDGNLPVNILDSGNTLLNIIDDKSTINNIEKELGIKMLFTTEKWMVSINYVEKEYTGKYIDFRNEEYIIKNEKVVINKDEGDGLYKINDIRIMLNNNKCYKDKYYELEPDDFIDAYIKANNKSSFLEDDLYDNVHSYYSKLNNMNMNIHIIRKLIITILKSRCDIIFIEDKEYIAKYILICCLYILCNHKSIYDNEFKRFVSSKEYLLYITMMFLKIENISDILTTLFISCNNKYYSISKSFIMKCSNIIFLHLIKNYESSSEIVYDAEITNYMCKNIKYNHIQEEHIYKQHINIYDIIDFNNTIDLIYFVDKDVIRKYYNNKYGPLKIIDNIISENYNIDNAKKQYISYLCSSKIRDIRKLDTYYNLSKNISDETIAGLVGAIPVSDCKYQGSVKAYVTLDTNNINILHAIKKPLASLKEYKLTDKEEENAINNGKYILEKGFKLKSSNTPYGFINEAMIYLKKSGDITYYQIEKGDFSINTKSPVIYKKNIAYIEVDRDILCDDIINYGIVDGISDFSILEKILPLYSKEEIQRATTLMRVYSDNILFSNITKSSIEITPYDFNAYKLLYKLCVYFPSAIVLDYYNMKKFNIKNTILLENIRNIFLTYLKTNDNDTNTYINGDNLYDRLKRVPYNHQKKATETIYNRYINNNPYSFIWMPVGSGKTYIILTVLTNIIKNNIKNKFKYIVYTLPSSALKSIIDECINYGFSINYIHPIIASTNIKSNENIIISKTMKLYPNMINIIEHDHVRIVNDELIKYASETYFIVDEVHKTLNNTIRTHNIRYMSALSNGFALMTGTPVIDNNIYKLVEWLKFIVNYDLNENNFWTSINSIIYTNMNTGVITEYIDIECVNINDTAYKNTLSMKYGGISEKTDMNRALSICYDICTIEMVKNIKHYMSLGKKIFVVAKDINHQELIKNMLSNTNYKIFLISNNNSINLTDDMVTAGKEVDYDIVITTTKKCEGYTLSRLNVMITSVYFCNNATIEQLEGRINRIGQKNKVLYITVHYGILTHIYNKHQQGKAISEILKSMTDNSYCMDI